MLRPRHLPLALVLALVPLLAWSQTRIGDVVYGHKMGVALTMDVFKPATPNGIGVIFVVSGGWYSNYDNINPGLAKIFTDRGMTVFEVLHGSQPKFIMPEIISDVTRSIRFIHANAKTYGVDPNRLGISGMSAGGHLSLMMAARGDNGNPDAKDPVEQAPSTVQAVACFFPPTDMLNWGKDGQSALTVANIRPYWPAFGITDKTPVDDVNKMAVMYSPVTWTTAKMPPTLIFHGDKDPLVPLQQSQLYMKKLEELNVPHELDVEPGGMHGWPNMVPDIVKCAVWFEKYLGKKS